MSNDPKITVDDFLKMPPLWMQRMRAASALTYEEYVRSTMPPMAAEWILREAE